MTANRVRIDGPRIEADEFVVRASSGGFRAQHAVLEPDRIQLDELQWFSDATARRRNLQPPCAPPRPAESGAYLRAESAIWRASSGWQFEKLATTRPLLPLGSPAAETPRDSTGMLPPDFVATSGGFGGFARFLEGHSGLGVGADAVPANWYGIGPVARTRPRVQQASFRRRRASMLDLRLTLGRQASSPGWLAMGEFRRGDRRTHVEAAAEAIARDRHWEVARVRRADYPREWRETRAGAFLGGDEFTFDLHFDRTAGPTELPDLAPGYATTSRLTYGADHRLSDTFELETDFSHRSSFREAADSLHGSTLYTGIRGETLPADGVDVVGEIGGRLGTRLQREVARENDETYRSLAVRTSGQLLAHLALQGRVTGRFDRATHRVRPRIDVYREIAGFGGTGETPWGRAPGNRSSRWTALSARIDQTWLARGGGRLATPVGLIWNGSGLGEALAPGPHPYGRVELAKDRVRLEGGGIWDGQFDDFRGWAGFDFGSERLRVGGRTSTLGPGDHALAVLESASAGLSQASRRLQFRLGGTERSAWWHRVSVSWSHSLYRLRGSTMLAASFDRWALNLGGSRAVPPLGWGVSLNGMMSRRAERWGLVLGVEPSPGS